MASAYCFFSFLANLSRFLTCIWARAAGSAGPISDCNIQARKIVFFFYRRSEARKEWKASKAATEKKGEMEQWRALLAIEPSLNAFPYNIKEEALSEKRRGTIRYNLIRLYLLLHERLSRRLGRGIGRF